MWFGDYQRANIIKTHGQRALDYVSQILITILHSIVNTIKRTYVYNQKINKHALPITITK